MPISLVYNKYTYLALYITHVNIQVRLSMFIFSMGLLHKVENSMGSKQSICIYIYKCTLYRNMFLCFVQNTMPTHNMLGASGDTEMRMQMPSLQQIQ